MQGNKHEELTVQASKDKPAGGGIGGWFKRVFSGGGNGKDAEAKFLESGFSEDPDLREVQEAQAAAVIGGGTTIIRGAADTLTDTAKLIAAMNPNPTREHTLMTALERYEQHRDSATDQALRIASQLDDDAATAGIVAAAGVMVVVDALNPAPGGGEARVVEAAAGRVDEAAAVAVKVIEKLEDASKGGFIVHPNGTAVHRSQAEMVESITGAGATKVGYATRTTEGGEIFRMNTPNGPMDVRVMDGQPSGGVNQGPRTVTTRAGTNQGVHPNGAQVKAPARLGGPTKNEVQEAMHTHGQVNDR